VQFLKIKIVKKVSFVIHISLSPKITLYVNI